MVKCIKRFEVKTLIFICTFLEGKEYEVFYNENGEKMIRHVICAFPYEQYKENFEELK